MYSKFPSFFWKRYYWNTKNLNEKTYLFLYSGLRRKSQLEEIYLNNINKE